MKRKYILIAILIMIPIAITIGFSTWIIMKEVVSAPTYIENYNKKEVTINSENVTLSDIIEGGVPTVSGNVGINCNYEIVDTSSIEALEFTTGGSDTTTYNDISVTIKATPTEKTYMYKETTATLKLDLNIKAVAYLSGGNYFGTIEKALTDVSSGNVFVIPGTNPTIKNDCEVKSGVTLTLPYEGETWENRSGTLTDNFFADGNATLVSQNRKSLVKILDGKTLTNNGIIQVGGILGRTANTYLQGSTSGAYAEILMEDNSKIISNGQIHCAGYIKKESNNDNCGRVIANNTASIQVPFVIDDYYGGTHTVGAYAKGNTMPFMQFEFPNIQATMEFHYGAVLKAYVGLYSGNLEALGQTVVKEGFQHSMVNIIGYDTGENAILMMKKGSLFVFENRQENINYTTSKGKTIINIYGECYNGSMIIANPLPDLEGIVETAGKFGMTNISVEDMTVDTSKVHFPLTYKFDLVIKSAETINSVSYSAGDFSVKSKIKVMPGANVVVEDGATLTIDAETIIYESFNDNRGVATLAKYPSGLEPAYVLNDGNMYINAAFGGLIKTSIESNAYLEINTSTLTVTTTEGTGSKDGLNFAYTATNTMTSKLNGNTTDGNAFATGNIYISEVGQDTWTLKTQSVIELVKVNVTETNKAEAKEGSNYAIYVSSDGTDANSSKLTSNEVSKGYYIKVTGTNINSCSISTNTWIQVNEEISISITYDKESCFAAGSLITLADGSTKKIEDLTIDDMVLVYDHEIGDYVAVPILFIENDGWDYYNVINLEFSDGTKTRLIYEHGLFDLELNKYVYITESNYMNYVGHRFAMIDLENNYKVVTLENAYITNEYTGCYSIATVYYFNHFIDGLFSVAGGITGLFNFFEYDENLKYDEELMKADIEKYGLYTYEEFAEYMPYEVFEALPIPYAKVSVGKGYITHEELLGYIDKYLIKNGIL